MPTLVNIFFPGLGQLMQGRLITAVVCFLLTIAGYLCFVLPGLVMHLLVILDSAGYDKRVQQKMHNELLSTIRQK